MGTALVVSGTAQIAETHKRTQLKTYFDGGVVSTVWLMGIDHSFGGDKPILFETMIFGGEHDDEMERYHSYEEAVEGHARWVEKCK
jgi:hypothetical protein